MHFSFIRHKSTVAAQATLLTSHSHILWANTFYLSLFDILSASLKIICTHTRFNFFSFTRHNIRLGVVYPLQVHLTHIQSTKALFFKQNSYL